MTNTTTYTELQNRRTLIMDTFSEIKESMLLPAAGMNPWIVILLVIGGLVSSLGVVLVSCHLYPPRTPNASKAIFFAAFQEKIRKKFMCQREDTFNTLIMGVNRVLKKNTEEPTVFLVLASYTSMSTAMRLVTMLIHCTLLAYNHGASERHIEKLISDGNKFTSHNDEWPFYYHLRKQLRFYGIAAVSSFEKLHPQVIRTMQFLVPMVCAPFHEAVVVLVANFRNRFTEHQMKTLSPNNLGKIFLQDLLSPYYDQSELKDTINQIGSRCILINPE